MEVQNLRGPIDALVSLCAVLLQATLPDKWSPGALHEVETESARTWADRLGLEAPTSRIIGGPAEGGLLFLCLVEQTLLSVELTAVLSSRRQSLDLGDLHGAQGRDHTR